MSLYDNPKLRVYRDKEAAAAAGGVRGEAAVVVGKETKQKMALHEEILVFVSQEWRDLKLEVCNA